VEYINKAKDSSNIVTALAQKLALYNAYQMTSNNLQVKAEQEQPNQRLLSDGMRSSSQTHRMH
jgi:hypothetical protein